MSLILIDRKNKKHVVCETRRGGAEVQLPPAGTRHPLLLATGGQGMGVLIGNSPAPGGACGTGQYKPQGGRSWSARRVHAPEVAGSNPAPASREASITIIVNHKSPLVSRVDGKEAGRCGGSVTRNTGYTRMGVQIPPASIHLTLRSAGRTRERQVRDGNASRFHVCNGLARRPGFNKKSALPPQAATMEAKGHGQPSRIRHDTARSGFNSRLRHSGALPGL